MTVRGKIVRRLLWPSFTRSFIFFSPLFPCPDLVYQAPVFKLNITSVLLRKLWWFNHCQWSYASRAWPARQKGPSAVVRPAAKGLILWSKNCRLPHMFPINVECSVGLEEAFIMKWPSLHQTPPCCLPGCLWDGPSPAALSWPSLRSSSGVSPAHSHLILAIVFNYITPLPPVSGAPPPPQPSRPTLF